MGFAVAPSHAEREIVGQQPSDLELVASVRGGDDRAFEQLFARYQRRIAAYVVGMVHDHGRAEDITQEIFISALRRMRETDRPIAFKPWIYEIAKNACIDQFRRSRRTEEVSYDAEEGLGAADYGRLAQTGPSPDAAVDQKQALHDLCGAFGGLSETHHQILVLRELEGLSYREIGDRLGMSRPAVESTLFRARRRLTEEYDELVSGQRCLRVQALIGTAADGLLGARDSRRLARHLSHCQPCRRQARVAGVDGAVMARRPSRREAIAAKIAGLLPFPAFLRARRHGEPDSVFGAGAAGPGHTLMAQLPALGAMPEPVIAGWGKAAAAAATIVIAGVGAGVGAKVVERPAPAERPPARVLPAAEHVTAASRARTPGRAAATAPAPAVGRADTRPAAVERRLGGTPFKAPAGRPSSPAADRPAAPERVVQQPAAPQRDAPAPQTVAPDAPKVEQPKGVELPAAAPKDGASGQESPTLALPLGGAPADEPKGEAQPSSDQPPEAAKVVEGLQSALTDLAAGAGAGSGG
ncbi:MAG TPA: sigma-70 family RNA polymerase sigma factor [Solirubrobacteraceae bacterium]|jgi:RNA polymerase sigma factor (sigma-70 family)